MMPPLKRRFTTADLGSRRSSRRQSATRLSPIVTAGPSNAAPIAEEGVGREQSDDSSGGASETSTLPKLDDRRTRLTYTSAGLTQSNQRAALVARSKPYSSVLRYSVKSQGPDSPAQTGEAGQQSVDYAFSINTQQTVLLSPDGRLSCACPRPSRNALCEHIWTVQESLIEHADHGFDPWSVMWKYNHEPIATVEHVPLPRSGEEDPSDEYSPVVRRSTSQARLSGSVSLYALFDSQRTGISRRSSWLEHPGQEQDERDLQTQTAQIMALCSPGLVLPGETLEDDRLSFAERGNAKLTEVILAVSRSDTRIHAVLQSLLSLEEVQNLLLERVQARISQALGQLERAVADVASRAESLASGPSQSSQLPQRRLRRTQGLNIGGLASTRTPTSMQSSPSLRQSARSVVTSSQEQQRDRLFTPPREYAVAAQQARPSPSSARLDHGRGEEAATGTTTSSPRQIILPALTQLRAALVAIRTWLRMCTGSTTVLPDQIQQGISLAILGAAQRLLTLVLPITISGVAQIPFTERQTFLQATDALLRQVAEDLGLLLNGWTQRALGLTEELVEEAEGADLTRSAQALNRLLSSARR